MRGEASEPAFPGIRMWDVAAVRMVVVLVIGVVCVGVAVTSALSTPETYYTGDVGGV